MLSLTPIVACTSTSRSNQVGGDGGAAGEASATAHDSDPGDLVSVTSDGASTSTATGGGDSVFGTSSSMSSTGAGGSSGGTTSSDLTSDAGGASAGGAGGADGTMMEGTGGGSTGGTGGESTNGTGGGSTGGTGGGSTGGSGGGSTEGTGGGSTGGTGGGSTTTDAGETTTDAGSDTTTTTDGASTGGTGGEGGTGGAMFGGGPSTSMGGAGSTTSSMTSTTGVSCPVGGSCTSECPCGTGEGACTNDNQCEDGLVCTTAAVAKLGFSGGARSCMPEHCDNDEFDAELGETSQDCGGECGCRATFEEIDYQGVPSWVNYIFLDDMSGDGSTLVGYAYDAGTYPIVVSAAGAVTLLEAYGVNGSATHVSDDGSIVSGWLHCDNPPTCTSGNGVPFRWSDAGSPIEYPFSTTVAGMSSSGNVVVYTEQSTNPDEAHRLVMSTGSNTSTAELSIAYGVSGNGAVVFGILAGNGNTRVWFSQTGEIWVPSYPSGWVGAGFTAVNADGSVFAGTVLVDGASRAYISQDRNFELLDAPDDRFTAIGPSDMTADGSRMVGYGYNQDTSASEGMFWDEEGGLRTLYDELTARGLEFPLDVTEIGPADFISSNGRIIVGNGPTSDLLPFYRVVLAD